MFQSKRALKSKIRGLETLGQYSTSEIVDELSKRPGVETTTAGPYQDVQIKVNGPAIVLKVFD